ncbi:helix-turn-helix domain-containing protein [Enterococcus sp. DIV0187]|uniref:helix-turn-helix domain-containing protein n=1 Tax=Enterococcus sp. DIV0187 TaxID=2774644 RepID=UPI003F230169
MAKLSKEAKTKYQQALGYVLKGYREMRNITMNELADKIGKTQATVSRYETGEIGITKPTLSRIVNILQIPDSDLPQISTFEDFKDDDAGIEMMLAMNDKSVVQLDQIESVVIPRSFTEKYQSTMLMKIETTNLEPRLFRDSIAIIDLDGAAKNNTLVYCIYDDQEMICKYEVTDQSFLLTSDISQNGKDYFEATGDSKTFVINKHDPRERRKLNIIGVIVGYMSDINKLP